MTAPPCDGPTDALLLTAVSKIDKKALRARYWTGQQRMVG